MTRLPVESTDVVSVGYDPNESVMEIEFYRPVGSVYRYYDVEQSLFETFMAAPSKGRFVNIVLKRLGYAYDKVA